MTQKQLRKQAEQFVHSCATTESEPPVEGAARGSAVEMAIRDIARLEEALKPVLKLAELTHSSVMRASERIGVINETGAAHACLGLMEVSVRALRQANDAARYSRHSMQYPPNAELSDRASKT